MSKNKGKDCPMDDSEFLEKDKQRRAGEIVYKQKIEEFEKEADSGGFKVLQTIVETVGAFVLIGYILWELWRSETGVGKSIVIIIILMSIGTFVFKALAKHYYLKGDVRKFKVANTISQVSSLSISVADAITPGGDKTMSKIEKTQSAVKDAINKTKRLSALDDDESVFANSEYSKYRDMCYSKGLSIVYSKRVDDLLSKTRTKLMASTKFPIEYRRDLILTFYIVNDYRDGLIRDDIIPYNLYCQVLGALSYFSEDKLRSSIIPNFIPGLGYTDDMFMCNCVLAGNVYSIRAYKCWRMEYKTTMRQNRDKLILEAISESGDNALKNGKDNEIITVVNGDMTWDTKDVGNLFALVKCYLRKEYTAIPYASIIVAVGAILYWVLPEDFIPDKITGIGKIDDTMVAGIAITAIKTDLNDFVEWNSKQKISTPIESGVQLNDALNNLTKIGG